MAQIKPGSLDFKLCISLFVCETEDSLMVPSIVSQFRSGIANIIAETCTREAEPSYNCSHDLKLMHASTFQHLSIVAGVEDIGNVLKSRRH